MTKVQVRRGKMIEEVSPRNLTTNELCHLLNTIDVAGGSWMPEETKKEGYAAIKEAIRRLKGGMAKNGK